MLLLPVLMVAAAAAAVGVTGVAVDDEGSLRLAEIEELKNTIHLLPADEANRRFAALRRRTSPPPRQDQIDHFVVLCVL